MKIDLLQPEGYSGVNWSELSKAERWIINRMLKPKAQDWPAMPIEKEFYGAETVRCEQGLIVSSWWASRETMIYLIVVEALTSAFVLECRKVLLEAIAPSVYEFGTIPIGIVCEFAVPKTIETYERMFSDQIKLTIVPNLAKYN